MHLIKLFVNLCNRNIKLCRGLLYHLTGQPNQLHVKITKSREVGTYLCFLPSTKTNTSKFNLTWNVQTPFKQFSQWRGLWCSLGRQIACVQPLTPIRKTNYVYVFLICLLSLTEIITCNILFLQQTERKRCQNSPKATGKEMERRNSPTGPAKRTGRTWKN